MARINLIRHFAPAIFLFLSLTCVRLGLAGDMAEFLDSYDEIVTVYEKYANKGKLCAADALTLNTEVLPKLLTLSQQAQTSQGSMSADDLNRYMEVMTRYTNALMKLSSKMDKFDC